MKKWLFYELSEQVLKYKKSDILTPLYLTMVIFLLGGIFYNLMRAILHVVNLRVVIALLLEAIEKQSKY